MITFSILFVNLMHRLIFCGLAILGVFIVFWVANWFLPVHQVLSNILGEMVANADMSRAWLIAALIGMLIMAAEVFGTVHCLYRSWSVPRIEKLDDGRYVKTRARASNPVPATKSEMIALDNMEIIRRKLGFHILKLRTDLHIEEEKELNAHTVGMGVPGRGEHAICLSSGLLETMPRDGVAAVIAHEMGHVKKGDSATFIFMACFLLLVSFVLFAPIYVLYLFLNLAGRVLLLILPSKQRESPFLFMEEALVRILRVLETLAMWPAQIYQRHVLRLCEFRADSVASRCVGPRSICRVLFLLSRNHSSGGRSMLFNLREKLKMMNAAHPPPEDRIRAVRQRIYAQ